MLIGIRRGSSRKSESRVGASRPIPGARARSSRWLAEGVLSVASRWSSTSLIQLTQVRQASARVLALLRCLCFDRDIIDGVRVSARGTASGAGVRPHSTDKRTDAPPPRRPQATRERATLDGPVVSSIQPGMYTAARCHAGHASRSRRPSRRGPRVRRARGRCAVAVPGPRARLYTGFILFRCTRVCTR